MVLATFDRTLVSKRVLAAIEMVCRPLLEYLLLARVIAHPQSNTQVLVVASLVQLCATSCLVHQVLSSNSRRQSSLRIGLLQLLHLG